MMSSSYDTLRPWANGRWGVNVAEMDSDDNDDDDDDDDIMVGDGEAESHDDNGSIHNIVVSSLTQRGKETIRACCV